MAHFSGDAFFDALDAGSLFGGAADAVKHLTAGGAVHQLVQSGTQQMPAVPGDNEGGRNGGYIVGRLEAFAANQRDADAQAGGQRGNGVAAMVPGVGPDRRTVNRIGLTQDEAKEAFLDEDNNEEDEQSEGGGRLVGLPNFQEGD